MLRIKNKKLIYTYIICIIMMLLNAYAAHISIKNINTVRKLKPGVEKQIINENVGTHTHKIIYGSTQFNKSLSIILFVVMIGNVLFLFIHNFILCKTSMSNVLSNKVLICLYVFYSFIFIIVTLTLLLSYAFSLKYVLIDISSNNVLYCKSIIFDNYSKLIFKSYVLIVSNISYLLLSVLLICFSRPLKTDKMKFEV